VPIPVEHIRQDALVPRDERAIDLRNRGHHGCTPDAVLTVMRAPSDELFLVCDECESCLSHPDRAWALDGPDFDGNTDPRCLAADYATMEDIAAAGWEPRWFFNAPDIR
jgi:hypothetical protein